MGWVLWDHFVVVVAAVAAAVVVVVVVVAAAAAVAGAAVWTGQSGGEGCGRRSHQVVVPQDLYAAGGARNQYQTAQADPSGCTRAVEGMGCSGHQVRYCSTVHP